MKRAGVAPGAMAPFIYYGETRDILAGVGNIVGHQPVITEDGRLVFIGHDEKAKGAQLRYNNADMPAALGALRGQWLMARGRFGSPLKRRVRVAPRKNRQRGVGEISLSLEGETE